MCSRRITKKQEGLWKTRGTREDLEARCSIRGAEAEELEEKEGKRVVKSKNRLRLHLHMDLSRLLHHQEEVATITNMRMRWQVRPREAAAVQQPKEEEQKRDSGSGLTWRTSGCGKRGRAPVRAQAQL